MNVLQRFVDGDVPVGYHFWCPGCKMGHAVYVDRPSAVNGARWTFNGDMEKPTFTPSLLVRFPRAGKIEVCHSFVRLGQIMYLTDSTHELAGKTVDLVDIDIELA